MLIPLSSNTPLDAEAARAAVAALVGMVIVAVAAVEVDRVGLPAALSLSQRKR